MSAVTADERERITEALRGGMSQNQAARRFGRSVGTVNALARECGVEYSKPKNAAIALVDYCQANRLHLLNRFFDKAAEILEHVGTPQELQQLSIALAVLTDKRRLEDGEATSRSEVTDSRDDARARLNGRLDELAARRDARRVAG